MTQPAAFFTIQELVSALGENTYFQLFDDFQKRDRNLVDVSLEVTLVVKRATAQVLSYLPIAYGDTIPAMVPASAETEISNLLKDSALRFAMAMAYQRKPEWAKTHGFTPYLAGGSVEKGAESQMLRIQAAIQRIHAADKPVESKPRNVSGASYDGGPKITIASTVSNGNDPTGDW